MKRFWLVLFFLPVLATGQNFQCLQSGVKHYFTNSNGYLRGIRIDSVTSTGSDSIYYPFHTPRGDYNIGALDSNGGSWLGKKVVQKTDGTFLFDNIWGDTVVIKSKANTGDSWVFCNDSSNLYYRAEVLGVDTMNVLGAVDSVKKILITARNPSGIVTSDVADSFQILLSKNNGFVSVFDLYDFPYRKPGAAFGTFVDYYLDVITGGDYFWHRPPTAATAVFKLISFQHPTFSQLYDWNVGDVFEYSTILPGTGYNGSWPYSYFFDSITNKTILPYGVQYDFVGWLAKYHTPFYFSHSYDLSSTSGSLTYYNSVLLDTTLMPEERNQEYEIYYNPSDSSRCLRSSSYRFVKSDPFNSHWSEAYPLILEYKTGLGLVKYIDDWSLVVSGQIMDTTLLYNVKGGLPCGLKEEHFPIYNIDQVKDPSGKTIKISPNPARSVLYIKTPDDITTVSITNIVGRVIFSEHYNGHNVQIDVADLPAGVYFIRINGTEVRRFVKE